MLDTGVPPSQQTAAAATAPAGDPFAALGDLFGQPAPAGAVAAAAGADVASDNPWAAFEAPGTLTSRLLQSIWAALWERSMLCGGPVCVGFGRHDEHVVIHNAGALTATCQCIW